MRGVRGAVRGVAGGVRGALARPAAHPVLDRRRGAARHGGDGRLLRRLRRRQPQRVRVDAGSLLFPCILHIFLALPSIIRYFTLYREVKKKSFTLRKLSQFLPEKII